VTVTRRTKNAKGDGERLCVGQFGAPHGVRGALHLHSFTEDPMAILGYAPLLDEDRAREFKIKKFRGQTSALVVKVDGIEDREAAFTLKGVKLYLDPTHLPALKSGQFYERDLIGVSVWSEANDKVGEIDAVHDYGAGTIIEIKPLAGPTFMLPFNKNFVPEIDLGARSVTVIIPDGWLKDSKKEEKA
jgi:16S rRNA processing protein RimM